MARTLSRSADAALYEEDVDLWVERQADLLRKEYLEDLDLLKTSIFTGNRPAQGPAGERVGKQRDDLELEITPSLRRHVTADLDSIFQEARRRAVDDLARDHVTHDQLPATCAYTVDQIPDLAWRPANVHGIEDPAP